jgi:hypothetical protein
MKNTHKNTKTGQWVTFVSGAVALVALVVSWCLLFTEVSRETPDDRMIDAAVVLFSLGFFALVVAGVSLMLDKNFRRARDFGEVDGAPAPGVPVADPEL